MPIKTLNIHTLRIDGGTQSRVAINLDTVAEYSTAMEDGELPEPVVFFDGVDDWLADGFHRYHAHLKVGKASMIVDRRKGTQRDAILYSLAANISHGLRPSNDDKRKAVGIMLADAEWAEMSDREIARHCGCSHPLVAQMRHPKPDVRAPLAAPKGGNSSTPSPTKSVTSDAAAAHAPTEKQRVAQQNAQDAHGDDADPIVLLEQAQKEITGLQQELFAASADDKKAEILKWKRLADVAQRRQVELQETVNSREGELKRLMDNLRRVGRAVGEQDPFKVAATVEALVRETKAVK